MKITHRMESFKILEKHVWAVCSIYKISFYFSHSNTYILCTHRHHSLLIHIQMKQWGYSSSIMHLSTFGWSFWVRRAFINDFNVVSMKLIFFSTIKSFFFILRVFIRLHELEISSVASRPENKFIRRFESVILNQVQIKYTKYLLFSRNVS